MADSGWDRPDLPCGVLFGTLSIIQSVSRCWWTPASLNCVARCFPGIRRDCLAPRHVARRVSKVEVKFLNTGTVKWFNAAKGFGFIQPEGGGADAFVHVSAVERAGLDGLNEGDRVEYELVRGQNGKSSAENLKLAS